MNQKLKEKLERRRAERLLYSPATSPPHLHKTIIARRGKLKRYPARVCVKMSPELKGQLKAYCQKNNIKGVGFLVRELLIKWIAKKEIKTNEN